MERQFTATAYIVDQDRVLLLLHPKLKKWLPPGGHLELNETPPEAAKREVFEETGLQIEFIRQENVYIDQYNAKSIECPYLCLLEEIPTFHETKAHQHIDFVYVARPLSCSEPKECHLMRWFTLDEVEALPTDETIFLETKEVVRSIFSFLQQTKLAIAL